MKVLDLFCGAGGSAVGYHRAGFEVVGVDIVAQPNFPFEFVQGDVLNLPVDVSRFDLIHASPPCQSYSVFKGMLKARGVQPVWDSLIDLTREILEDSGKPYVIENVPAAPLRNPVRVCGGFFPELRCDRGPLRRHRLFESNLPLVGTPCDHSAGRPLGVYHQPGQDSVWKGAESKNGANMTGRTATVSEARLLMGIDWTDSWKELKEAIPPPYTNFIGRQLAELM